MAQNYSFTYTPFSVPQRSVWAVQRTDPKTGQIYLEYHTDEDAKIKAAKEFAAEHPELGEVCL